MLFGDIPLQPRHTYIQNYKQYNSNIDCQASARHHLTMFMMHTGSYCAKCVCYLHRTATKPHGIKQCSYSEKHRHMTASAYLSCAYTYHKLSPASSSLVPGLDCRPLCAFAHIHWRYLESQEKT